MKRFFKFLMLASFLLMSSRCYATEAKQNDRQVSATYEYIAYDVGWNDATLEVISFEARQNDRQFLNTYEYMMLDVKWQEFSAAKTYFEIPLDVGKTSINTNNFNNNDYSRYKHLQRNLKFWKYANNKQNYHSQYRYASG